MAKKILTTKQGVPVADNQNSFTAGQREDPKKKTPVFVRFSTVVGAAFEVRR